MSAATAAARRCLPLAASLGLLTLVGGTTMAAEVPVIARSVDEVADGAMPLVTQITSADARLVFRSTRPLACSVVFGETAAFGSIATDDDMDGGAHHDHGPVIAGLKPATEYFFRVQGVAADGTLYVGETQRFRTLEAPAASATNLALLDTGARVSAVSSNYGGGRNDQPWGADSALDGNRRTAWSSAGDGDDAYFEIAFAAETEVGQVSVWTRTMSDGTATILEFTMTTDNGAVHGPFVLPDSGQAYSFPIGETTRTLRLDVIRSTGGNVGLVEFAVF
ncbi:MAG: discoidin domain-containing protein [Alphaproteobacteria bacterium]